MSKKYYVLTFKKWISKVCTTENKVNKLLTKHPKATINEFNSLKEASQFIESKNTNQNNNKIKKCVICGKPLNKKGWYCLKCINQSKKVSDFIVEKYHLLEPIYKSTFARIAQLYPNESDIFDFIYENPSVVLDYFHMSKYEKQNLRDGYKNDKNELYLLDLNNVPKYISNYFLDNEDKELIDISGDEKNPIIKCKCKRCNNEFILSFQSLDSTSFHQCDAILSKGEYLVKKYLQDKGVDFLTQFKTLKCVNPKTNNILPYDFELPTKKIIIEVQGDQHIKYTSYFHRDIDAFEYQKYKDSIKKDFALKNGYTYIEIFYKDINNGNYKKILNKYL